MTLPDEIKQLLMRQFHIHTVTPGWTFTGSGPNEKDRQLLVEYHVVAAELNLLEPAYREIILDICQKMANGMADYCHAAAQSSAPTTVESIADYDLYCQYVARRARWRGPLRALCCDGQEGGRLACVGAQDVRHLQRAKIIRNLR